MPTQIGYIDLSATNSVMLAAEAGWSSDLEDYATKSDLTVSANNIKSEVSETYATKIEVRRTDSGTGTVITSDDAANLPPLSLTIHGKSVQDGTPSPSSPVEIESVEGLNLIDLSAFTQVSGTLARISNDGNGNPAGNKTTLIPVSPNTVYGLNAFGIGKYKGVRIGVHEYTESLAYTDDGWKNLPYTIKTKETTAYIGLVISFSETSTSVTTGGTESTSPVSPTPYSDWLEVQWTDGQLSGYVPHGAVAVEITEGNLLRSTDNPTIANASWNDTDDYCVRSGGNGVGSIETVQDGPFGEEVKTFRITGNTSGSRDFQQAIPAFMEDWNGSSWNGAKFTFEAWARGIGGNAYLQLRCYGVKSDNDGTSQFSNNVFNESITTEWTRVTYTFWMNGTLGSNTVCIRMLFGLAGAGSIEYAYPTVVHNSSITFAPIPLQGNALRSLPDGTEDTLEVDGEGNVTLTKRIGIKTFDGSESWGVNSNVGSGFAYTPKPADMASGDGAASVQLLLADRFVPKNASTGGNVYASGPNLLFYRDGGSFNPSSTAEAKAWFAANPTTVIYKLASEQTIPLGKIDLPSLPSPSFSLHVDAAVSPTLDAEWWTQGGEEVGSVYQRTSALEQDVDGITLELSEKVDSSEEWVSWLHAGTDATTHEPYLAMGKNSAYPSVVYGSDAARFYDGEGDDASNVVAEFGSSAIIGKIGVAHVSVEPSNVTMYGPDGEESAVIKYTGVSYGSATKYGIKITDENDLSYVSILPIADPNNVGQYLNKLDYSAVMDSFSFISHSGARVDINNAQASMGYDTQHLLLVDGYRVSMTDMSSTPTKMPMAVDWTGNLSILGTASTAGYSQTNGSVTLGANAQSAWLTALGMDVETIHSDSAWTIKRFGHVVSVQCHGYSGTATTSAAKLSGKLTNYAPAYNVSATISTSSGTSTQVARLCVYTTGDVYIVPAGYTGSASWYGTLTYIY